MGGNVFTGRTSSIRCENIESTLEHYLRNLRIMFRQKADVLIRSNFTLLGSAGKKDVSGDIDLGINVTMFNDLTDDEIISWNLNPSEVYTEFEKLAKRARTSTVSQLWMKAFLRILGKHINENSFNIECDLKGITTSNMFTMSSQWDYLDYGKSENVQIDWIIGDIKWLQFSYHSEAYPEGDVVKGLHRTQLLLACFQVANMSFNHTNGVKCKTNNEIIATTPSGALYELSKFYDVNFTRLNTNSYYELHDLLYYELSLTVYEAIINEFLKILDSTRCDVPKFLQIYWQIKKESLGLTGKYLPETSKLREFI